MKAWGFAIVAVSTVLCVRALTTIAQEPPHAIASADHTKVFAPPARQSSYRFARTDRSIDEVTRFYRERFPSREPGVWKIERMAANDAFDGAAMFDRSRVARLYGGRHPRVARGSVTSHGRVTHVVLLMSPYPEPDLGRLSPGTLIMTVAVDP